MTYVRKKTEKYLTLLEAQASARQLGIKSSSEYKRHYRTDPKLPACPDVEYSNAWQSWYDFCGTKRPAKKYAKLIQAKAAVRKLGINTSRAYRLRWQEDPRLPANPYIDYANDWISWYDFCGSEKPIEKYLTLSEARSAVARLGISTVAHYNTDHHKDPKLPGDLRFYPEFTNWLDFIGKSKYKNFYQSISEASRAALALGIDSRFQYIELKRYKDDPKLPATPNYYYPEWKGWSHFFGTDNCTPSYETYELASTAAISLGIRYGSEYFTRRDEDPKLPAHPETKYKDQWKGWVKFLHPGKTKDVYETFEEARSVARSMNCKSRKDYYLRFKDDWRLRRDPTCVYPDHWTSWEDYLNLTERYDTLDAVREAAQRLGITTKRQYEQNYHKDPRLPGSPDQFKSDWKSWIHFFLPVKYTCLEDLRIAVNRLDIKDSQDYRKRYKNYPPLPAHPERVFRDEWTSWYDLCSIRSFYTFDEVLRIIHPLNLTSMKEYKDHVKSSKDERLPSTPDKVYYKEWTNWYAFLGKPEPFTEVSINAVHSKWLEDLQRFMKEARGGRSKQLSICRFLATYVQPNGFGATPAEFLSNKFIDLQHFKNYVTATIPENMKRSFVMAINEFMRFIIREDFTLEDDDTGELIIAEGISNPLRGSELDYSGPTNNSGLGESSKPALAYQYVAAMQKWIIPQGATNFSDLTHLHDFDADWVEIDVNIFTENQNDPDLVTRWIGGKFKAWFPMYWMKVLTLVSVPARGRQIAYCDSGEGDEYIPIYRDGNVVWIKNESQLAGTTKDQSFIKRYPGDHCGMHITSNKTSIGYKGYSVPWIPPHLVPWIIKLRQWQEKYNPITRPMPWIECIRTNLNESQRLAKGANCFLFRLFGAEEPGLSTNILTPRLAAALCHSQPRDLSLALLTGPKEKLHCYSSMYTPHSMRVSLITAYVHEFGLPIEITMKIAGHTSIVMNLYYVKIGSIELQRKFSEGEKRALQNQAFVAQSMIEQGRIDNINGQLVANSQEALDLIYREKSPGSYLFRDYGFCPYAGARCNDGGSLGKGDIWLPVPGGYLGSQNCIRCRHFVTGPAFIGGLLALGNEISLEVNLQFAKYDELQAKAEELRADIDDCDEREYELSKLGEIFESRDHSLEVKHRKLLAEAESAAKKLDVLMCDVQASASLIKQIEQVTLTKSEPKPQESLMLIVQEGHELRLALEETTHFHQLSEVCENAEIYECASANSALAARSQLLDKMLEDNASPQRMFRLNKEQQLLVGNQIARLLMSRLRSWERVDSLISGKIRLGELVGLESISLKELSEVFTNDTKSLPRA
ncbi:VPA1269 family protein [Pseudomonas guariconensis]|uniref:gamma-mobile-trio integrase GmtZ n=1 Tax=Pseudomonas guariconensis TaxID=1288410 RepID=UPI00209B1124|nr:VPA1269 family protein [Pseudomonas guariconensis]MCO7635100.1 VPA1269 family protein [Pseudomonas guariconensis]